MHGKTIAAVAANAAALARIALVQHDPERRMERLQPELFEILTELLYARFVADRRMRIRCGCMRLRRILAAVAVHVIHAFSLGVVRLKIVVRERPSGRHSSVMPDLSEVLAPEAEERGAKEFGVATDAVVCVRVEWVTVAVAPGVLALVFPFDVDHLWIPVVLLARNVIAPLEHQDPLASACQTVRQRSAARARADDNYVVMVPVLHVFLLFHIWS
jgi:hypothetical protein